MVFIGKASTDGKGGLDFGSEYNKARFKQWLKDNPGKPFKVDTNQKVSKDLRGYYFSAVIPEIRNTCSEWEKLSSLEMHDVVKKMLFYFETYNPLTKRTERFGKSVMADSDWNNTKKAMEFLDRIGDYLATCGIDMPDSQDYKRWRDSAPDVGEEYATRKRK